jgi:quercetin dioxygenase-like cupin family protein
MMRALVLAATLLAALTAPEVEITAEPHHHFILQNQYVRVFNVDVAPHAETLMHWHRHDYVYVILGAAHVSNDVKGKAPVDVTFSDGDTRFSPATFAHIARNLSGQPFRNVTIEYLQDEKLRRSAKENTAKWDATRGLDILEGGTSQILFVNDGVRATEFELQTNAVIPARSHSRPLLLIAVSDLDLYTRDPRTHGPPAVASVIRHFKSGNSTWLPLGFRRPIVNAGRHSAKFVTLEFP